jgi:Ice-binding-like/Bacterial Ig-like domain
MRKLVGLCCGRLWITVGLLGILAAGCGGGQAPILGIDGVGVLTPAVTDVTPVNGATGVVTYNTVVTASFNEPMGAIAGGASFTVTCVAPCVSPTGSVALDATNTIATFTLTPSTGLASMTQYTATVTGATARGSGLALPAPYSWKFTTGVAPSAPTITAVDPVNDAVGVPLNDTVEATFSEAMAPITGSASFAVTCAAPCLNPTGAVTLNANHTIATFTLAAGEALTADTPYTATITAARSLIGGVALTSPYVWQFTTGTTSNATRPAVLLTEPVTTEPGPTPGVAANSVVTATFSEDMAAATLNSTSFTLTCAAPCISAGNTVTYDTGTRTALLTPVSALSVGATYTATITTAATDLAGNALGGNQAPSPAASNYVWTFTTVTAAPPSYITVASTNPTAGAVGVCPSASVNATFTVPNGLRMNPSSINAATFTLTGPAPAVTSVDASSVTLDVATGTIATFTPQAALIPNGTYTATIVGGPAGVQDLAVPADDMVADKIWTFTVGPATGTCLAPVSLGSASPFGDFGGTAGSTNTGTQTVVNGDFGSIATATSSITGFHDTAGDVYTQTPANIGAVNGTIYTCTNSTTGPTSAGPNAANCVVATQALADAQSAYQALVAMPGGANPGANLAGLVLTPGVYTAPAGSFMIQGGNLTLNAQGNANAVFVFQMSTTLTVGGPGAAAPQSIILVGGAQAKNIFWQVGSAATINAGGGGTMVGTIISQAGMAFSTAGNATILTLNGRAISLGASVTLVDTVINVPGP